MRTTCEQIHSIDLATLNRRRYLKMGGADFRWLRGDEPVATATVTPAPGGVRIEYRPRDGVTWQTVVRYAFTAAPFGGWRTWFRCPACLKACRILFVPGSSVCCRQCASLAYSSQYESKGWTAQQKAERIRQRLTSAPWRPDAPFPPKPRRMRWQTYRGLERQYVALTGLWMHDLLRSDQLKSKEDRG